MKNLKQYAPYIFALAFLYGAYYKLVHVTNTPTSTIIYYETKQKCEEPFEMTFTLPNVRIENINRSTHFQVEDSRDFGKVLIKKIDTHKYERNDIVNIEKTECTSNGDCWLSFSFMDNNISTKNDLVIDPIILQKGGNINRANGYVIVRDKMCE